jgi:hypothetical protein
VPDLSETLSPRDIIGGVMPVKRFVPTAAVVLLFVIFIGTVSAGTAQSPGGKGQVSRLYLFAKDPVTGDIVKGGASGILSYKVPRNTEVMERFAFTGNRLAPETDYSLICYPDSGLIVLGRGKSDKSGYVHIEGSFNFGAIPIASGDNAKDSARVLLVLSRDIGTYQMLGWTPSMYLFQFE